MAKVDATPAQQCAISSRYKEMANQITIIFMLEWPKAIKNCQSGEKKGDQPQKWWKQTKIVCARF